MGSQALTPIFPGAETGGMALVYKLLLPPDEDVLALVAALSSNSAVEYAEPNHLYQISEAASEPADPYFDVQWGLHNTGQTGGVAGADIELPAAWEIITGSVVITVAVIDSGIDYHHPDLDDGRVDTVHDQDYVNGDFDAMDDNGHGTHVAGTIAAESNNGQGVAGVMWQATLLPMKVCDETGSCPSDAIAAAIRAAADLGARVINMSLGGSCSQTIADAVNYAFFDKNVVIVAAAGNDGAGVGYPGALDAVIAVGAMDARGARAYFSSFGDALDVMAPGVSILSTVPNGGYETFTGTSMASPHVAGVAGLLLAQRPLLTNGEVYSILRSSAVDLWHPGFDRQTGFGRASAYRALLAPVPAQPYVPVRGVCNSCSAVAAMAREPDRDSVLGQLRTVRDQLFAQEPGRRWTELYYANQNEVAWQVLADEQLRTDIVSGFHALDPALRALLTDAPAGAPALVTSDMVAAIRRPVMALAARTNPTLRAAILAEWARIAPERFVGQDVRLAWQQLRVENGPRQYLPLIGR